MLAGGFALDPDTRLNLTLGLTPWDQAAQFYNAPPTAIVSC